ncbi:MAG: Gfo/Idh/MocA family oxidoreductase [Chloroflexota bacterium]
MTQIIKWGILGPGAISRKFATGLQSADGAELLAIGSRNQERAQAFADEFGFSRAYGSYDELVNDPDVDAIYIGTPHSFHKAHSILCLRHGKHVICEKPFAINAKEAAEMIAVAREEKRVLMEAMWSRFLPTLVMVRALLNEEAIGEARMVQADFGFRTNVNPKGRLFDPALGGGALLDVGIYPVSLAYMLFGQPSQISSMANLGETGVDEETAVLFGYDTGQMAVLSTAIRLNTPHEAFILGTEGWIKIMNPWWVSNQIAVKRHGQEEEILDLPFKGNGYTHEAEEVMTLIREGRLESDVIPLDESLAIMQTLDEIRAELGVKYPME